jgi:5,10-methylene-tetrahydrofolate dehydrogenase/methenyl tetrahydrofolate cyclohydrolase
MAKFNVILERVETIVKQGAVMVEASTAEEARQIILADLEVDAGSYDDDLQPVEEGIGDMTVAVEKQHEPAHIPRSLAS